MSIDHHPADAPVLVTGAAGFVGSNLVRHLVEHGHRVRAMVRRREQAVGLPDVEIVEADLREPASLRRAVRGVAGIHHIASIFRQAGLPASEFAAANVEGVRNLLDAAIAAGVRRVVHCSTVGVLGDIAAPPADESTPYNPGDVYQASKMQGEQLALEYFRSGRIPGVVIRPAMVYGPGDTRTFKLFRMIAAGRFFYVGSGQTLMHFVDVRDLARAFELAMARTDRSGEVYIATGREAVPLRELADFSADYLRVRRPRLHLPVRPMQLLGSAVEAVCTPLRIPPPIFRRRVDFYTKNRAFSGEKAARELGFAVTRPFQQEVIEIIDSYLESGMIRMGARGAQEEPFLYRSLDGMINGWNRAAAACYGYPSQTAVGAVSHALLKTEFPEPLRRINEQLREQSVWKGRLRHVTRDGRRIEVESRWVMAQRPRPGALSVIEINREPEGAGTWSLRNAAGSLLCGLPALTEGLGGLAAV